jgi:hypothetical protein
MKFFRAEDEENLIKKFVLIWEIQLDKRERFVRKKVGKFNFGGNFQRFSSSFEGKVRNYFKLVWFFRMKV